MSLRERHESEHWHNPEMVVHICMFVYILLPHWMFLITV